MLLVFSFSVEAQQPTSRSYRLGYLDPSSRSGSADLLQAFRRRLSERGWIEGKNIAFEYRFADGDRERLPELAAELVRMKIDVIVVRGNPAAAAAKKSTSTIPIMMISAVEPVTAGFVASLASPERNMTGLVTVPPGLPAKRLELLKEITPRLTRVGVLMGPGNTGAGEQMKETKIAALTLKLVLQELRVNSEPDNLENVFQTAVDKRADAIITHADPFLFGERRRITELAAKRRIPVMYNQSGFVEAGGLMSYGTDLTDIFRRAAIYVDKILNGAKPADLPVEQPTKFEFIVNLKTAKQIGLTIPPNVLARADRVIR
jgi:putative ABC transport system substrate-binding protein